MIDSVKAKMRCNSTETSNHGNNYKTNKVNLGAICSQTGENKAFTDSTPSGACWMNIVDGYPAAEFFEPGQDYYVTFTKVPKSV